jgi:hypothetical protein
MSVDPARREAFIAIRDDAHELSADTPDAAHEHLFEAAFFEELAHSDHPDRGAAACCLGHSLFQAAVEMESYHQRWPPLLVRMRVWVAALDALLLARSELGENVGTDIAIVRSERVLRDRVALAQELLEPDDHATARLIEQAVALLRRCR